LSTDGSSERLPYGTPDDWIAVGSRPLFDEYERKLREVAADLLISADRHLVPDRKEELWKHEAGTVLALTFEILRDDRLSEVAWDEIEGSWLALAYDEPD
jgi:hypothetical protein